VIRFGRSKGHPDSLISPRSLRSYPQQPARIGGPKEGRRIEQEAAGEAVPRTAGCGDAGTGGQRRAVGAATWHGEAAVLRVPLLVRRAGGRGGGDIALPGLRAPGPLKVLIPRPSTIRRAGRLDTPSMPVSSSALPARPRLAHAPLRAWRDTRRSARRRGRRGARPVMQGGELRRGWRRSVLFAPSYPFGLSRLIISSQYFRSNSITRSRDA
jgi:hypothetical protein